MAGPIIWLERAESTNSELRKRIPGLDNLSAVAAKCQTAGRGQGDHGWYSEEGRSLCCSVLFKYGGTSLLKAGDMLLVTCVTTLAVRDFLSEHGIDSRIKWPNDIWVDGRKICGILIENVIEDGMIRESVVGIGLNVGNRSFPENLPNPVSMNQVNGCSLTPEDALVLLHERIRRRFAMLGTADGRNTLQEEFGMYMFRLNV